MSFLLNSSADVNKTFAIKIEEVFYTTDTEQRKFTKLDGSYLVFDLRTVSRVYVGKSDPLEPELNERIWILELKDGSEIMFYPIWQNDSPSFHNNTWEVYVIFNQHLKAFQRLYLKMSDEDKRFLYQFDEMKQLISTAYVY
jgi:hypothetical protein